ncbi:hypothetical protein CEXT_189301 [Caerostris extrusa]|uniref:Uncharacterized protein n=1 Tax=Caerostris extrusa TaxID=172846 RepID=A0AAV4P930_CAEEX|nr:hypothetical protein CEXT_189301 [Caerostris extrusa]
MSIGNGNDHSTSSDDHDNSGCVLDYRVLVTISSSSVTQHVAKPSATGYVCLQPYSGPAPLQFCPARHHDTAELEPEGADHSGPSQPLVSESDR